MEKISSLPNISRVGNLFSSFAKKKAGVLGKYVPGWTNDKIDSMLFVPKATDTKAVRLPRGCEQIV
ncbi:MAG: hypothetical protein OEV07_09445, partial [Gammaproteobacteria bacterium]|nr:hypothetical protein [Gammaproteobacteria bacterium]